MADRETRLFEAANKLIEAIKIASCNFSTINKIKHLLDKNKKPINSISFGGFEKGIDELRSNTEFNPRIFNPKNEIKTEFNTGANNSNNVRS